MAFAIKHQYDYQAKWIHYLLTPHFCFPGHTHSLKLKRISSQLQTTFFTPSHYQIPTILVAYLTISKLHFLPITSSSTALMKALAAQLSCPNKTLQWTKTQPIQWPYMPALLAAEKLNALLGYFKRNNSNKNKVQCYFPFFRRKNSCNPRHMQQAFAFPETWLQKWPNVIATTKSLSGEVIWKGERTQWEKTEEYSKRENKIAHKYPFSDHVTYSCTDTWMTMRDWI